MKHWHTACLHPPYSTTTHLKIYYFHTTEIDAATLLFMLVFGHDGSSAIKFNYYYELFVSFRALIQLPREHTSTFESLKVNQECSLVFG